MSTERLPTKLIDANARKRQKLDAIAPAVDCMTQQVESLRASVGCVLNSEELTVSDDWELWSARASELEHKVESLCRYLRWQAPPAAQPVGAFK